MSEEIGNHAEAMMIWLARLASSIKYKGKNVGEHTYVVGGAVRDWLLGKDVKDIDIVIDSVSLGGYDSDRLAKDIASRTNASVATNQYGVAIVTIRGDLWLVDSVGNRVNLQGEVLEIANARSESYGGEEGKGYKPHEVVAATIEQDVIRREFTFNTLLWRLSDLKDGAQGAEIIDLTGKGLEDLQAGVMRTPVDPDKTFTDDPTRMLRAIKFGARQGWDLDPETEASIRRNAHTLSQVPQNAVATILTSNVFPHRAKGASWVVRLGLDDILGEIYEKDAAFASTIDGELKSLPVKDLIGMIEAGLPFPEPWADLATALGASNVKDVNEALKRSANAELWLKTVNQPTSLIGDKTWFPGMAKSMGFSPKDFKIAGTFVREATFAALMSDPDLVLQPREFQTVLEDMLRDVIKVDD